MGYGGRSDCHVTNRGRSNDSKEEVRKNKKEWSFLSSQSHHLGTEADGKVGHMGRYIGREGHLVE